MSDIIAGVKQCSRCAALARDAAAALGSRPKVYDTEEDRRLATILSGAKKRCHPTRGHKNYGLRGILFRFDSVRVGVAWVRDNLGYPPPGYTLDRIDNDRHYEPGNLRWADRATQRRNQRPHDRLSDTGKRIRRLLALRPDYHYESIRSFVQRGLTDQEILDKRKWKNESKDV